MGNVAEAAGPHYSVSPVSPALPPSPSFLHQRSAHRKGADTTSPTGWWRRQLLSSRMLGRSRCAEMDVRTEQHRSWAEENETIHQPNFPFWILTEARARPNLPLHPLLPGSNMRITQAEERN